MKHADPLHAWLAEIGLAKYAPLFEEAEITLDVLPVLTEADILELKLPVGPRRRLLVALKALQTENQADRVPAADDVRAPWPRVLEGERRQITVMFCDLVDSTAYASRLDPEEWYGLLARYHAICKAAVEAYGGRVAQYLGDGVMVYFGVPTAHEDDAQRSVRAALEIVQAVAAVAATPPLAVRCGVATGEVVIGAQAEFAVGDTPNRACRMQSLASPNQICVCGTTRTLLASAFSLRALGFHQVKGIAGEVPVWCVEDAQRPLRRFQASRGGTDLTPMVGREQEIARLLRYWREACEGRGRIVLVGGEPGIGKSRLAQSFRAQLGQDRYAHLRYQCSPYHTNSAFHPIVGQIEAIAGFSRDDSATQRVDKLERMLAGPAEQRAEAAALLAPVLSLPSDLHADRRLAPRKQKERTLEVLVEQIELLSRQQPVLMLLEDVHWIDPSTQEVLELLATRIGGLRILALLTHRPEYAAQWPGQADLARISLERLSREQTAELVRKVAQEKSLYGELIDGIVARTDGVPLFVEEVTKSVLETGALHGAGAGAGGLRNSHGAIPATLKSSLVARLDRLPAEKEVLQIAACIGREFSFSLLARISGIHTTRLAQALERLVSAGMIFAEGAGADLFYVFKHALLQDVAYDLLLLAQRRRLHAEIAEVLSEDAAGGLPVHPELLAHHFAHGGQAARAIPHWRAAGERALRRFALPEAIAHFNSGLNAAATLEPSAERDRFELSIREPLNGALIALRGWAATEVDANAAAILELSKRTGRSETVLMGWYGMWISTLTQGRVRQSLIWPLRLLGQAQQSEDIDLLVLGHVGAMISNFYLGNLIEARRHGEIADSMYDPSRADRWVQLTGHDTRSVFLGWASHWTWMFGHPDRALRISEQKEQHAERLGYALDIAYALTVGAYVYDYCRLPEQLIRRASRAESLAREHGIANVYDAMVPQVMGLALLRSGDLKEAVSLLAKGIEHWNRQGGYTRVPYLKAALAEAHARSGRLSIGLGLIDDCMEQVGRAGWAERAHYAEILRLKGWMLMRTGLLVEAETWLRRSIAWAREQHAKSWELRASTTLAELLLEDGRREAARDLLQPVHASFVEGFGTPDLIDAADLLSAL